MPQTNASTVVLHPEPEGGFTLRVPAFRESLTYGPDEPQALAMAHEAIALSIEHRLATGEDIPPSDASVLRRVSVLLPSAA